MGGEEFSAKYRDRLLKELTESFETYKLHNESKNLFKAANTPITLGSVAMICYILSQVFGLVGIISVANILNLFMLAAVFLLLTWGYVRYSGKWTELGEAIDKVASTVWDSGLAPLFEKAMTEGSNLAAKKAVQRLNSTVQPPTGAMSIKKHI